jgi:uncharacterized membrane protein YtjA (UPF0391 family)
MVSHQALIPLAITSGPLLSVSSIATAYMLSTKHECARRPISRASRSKTSENAPGAGGVGAAREVASAGHARIIFALFVMVVSLVHENMIMGASSVCTAKLGAKASGLQA